MDVLENNISINNTEEFSMQVVLFEQRQRMRTIWLPEKKEGRYCFEDSEESDIPITITAMGGQWYVVASKGAHFIVDGKTTTEQILSQDRALIVAKYGSKIYTLYSEFQRKNDNVFLPYYIEKNANVSIGRTQENDICYPNELVSRNHAVLRWDGSGWNVFDSDSTNGVFVNGTYVKNARLKAGDVVYIMGLYIIAGAGFFGINNANQRVSFTSSKTHQICEERDYEFYSTEQGTEEELFDRKPRKKYKVDEKEIEIESPPMSMSANKIPLLLRMGNPLLMGGRSLVSSKSWQIFSFLKLCLLQNFPKFLYAN